jgi:hypothetical protein
MFGSIIPGGIGGAIVRLRQLLGSHFRQEPACELYLRDLLRSSGLRPRPNFVRKMPKEF